MSVRDQEFSDFVQARRSRLVGAAYTKQTITETYSPLVFDSSNKLCSVSIGKRWRQNGEVGQLDVMVTDAKYALPKAGWCTHGGKPMRPDSVNVTCATTTAPNGRPIVSAKAAPTASPSARWKGALLVRYVRPDGQVVEVSVRGMTKPSVTLQQLIAAAIDPAMSLPK